MYTVGFVPYLEMYPGPRISSPLEILEIHGDDDFIQVAKEIMVLTKLNWNGTKFFSQEPITIKFSRSRENTFRVTTRATNPATNIDSRCDQLSFYEL